MSRNPLRRFRQHRWLPVAVLLVVTVGVTATVVARRLAASPGADAVLLWREPPPTQPAAVAPSRGSGPSPSPSTGSRRTSGTPSTPAVPPAAAPLHYIANVGDQVDRVAALGYDLVDTGSNPETINALPQGTRALVWLGDLGDDDCAPPRLSFGEFTAAVDRLAGNPRVYGYFLADEPHPRACPQAVDELRARADYIHARDPSHRSFIVVVDGTNNCDGTYGCELSALRPDKSHVDLIGLDPYPCNVRNAGSGCAYQKIDGTVRRAVAAGIPRRAIVPVFQAFGQTCGSATAYYRLPTAAELSTIFRHWDAAVPRPAFDATYTWGRQSSACPGLVDADGTGGYPDLQALFRSRNATR